ncbi:hypothetical protein HPB47_007481 [Ixodes persulcatus]|uniref:Uncharacterized protein n=1 Tax=Ixodes persulcatus TaxID=34615 RepID=A0AC60P7P1_IXOPE|nr:hypothetical protein HPB47_007481 [Ixodes persulcatus]
MNSSLVLHVDTRGRPYRVEDFVRPLNQVGVREDVEGLGAFQMGHVWLLKLHTSAAKEKLLATGQLQVKDRLCLVIDPNKSGEPESEVKSTAQEARAASDATKAYEGEDAGVMGFEAKAIKRPFNRTTVTTDTTSPRSEPGLQEAASKRGCRRGGRDCSSAR